VLTDDELEKRDAAEEQLQEREAQYRAVFEATNDGMLIVDPDNIVVEVNPAACRMWGFPREEVIGSRVAVLNPQALAAIEAQGFHVERAVNIRKDGSPFHIEGRVTPITYRRKLHYLATTRDITEEVRAYELLEQRVEERTRELSALLEVARHVASTLDLQLLLKLILDELKVVADYTGSAVWTLEQDCLIPIATRGPAPEDEFLRLVSFAPKQLVTQLIRRGEPIIVDDMRSDEPVAQSYRDATASLFETTLTYVRSWLGVPLNLRGQVIGMLSVAAETPGFYTSHHLTMAQAIADQAAIAIDNARLYQKAQEVAALEERQRLSRELHDSVSQALYSIALGATTARAMLDRDPSQLREPIEFILSQAETGLAEMRALIFELRPETLEQEGLVVALGKQAAAAERRHRLPIETLLCAEPELSLAAKEALFRIAQEALHNTIKHAGATEARILLRAPKGEVVLEIQDDGKGFEADGSFPGHLGLRTMEERARGVGGALEIESALGAGTRVQVHLPYHPNS
jgi:PAS domain S-box-containing protein